MATSRCATPWPRPTRRRGRGADAIVFDAAIFNGEPADILRLTQGEIDITDTLQIVGGDINAPAVTITGDADGDDVVLAGGITDVKASLAADKLSDNSRIFDSSARWSLPA